MVACETCGLPLTESAHRCSHHAPQSSASAPGHLSRVAIAGVSGPTRYGSAATQLIDAPDLSPPHQFSSSPGPEFERATSAAGEHDPDPFDEAGDLDDSAPGADRERYPASPASPSGAEWDPDATTRFMPAYSSRNDLKNTAALVALAVFLVAAVSSLAWLIGQSVTADQPLVRASVGATPTASPISTVVPKNATVCTPEVARSTNTSCTLARRVLSAVRTLGTDLPDSFRVTVVNPQTAKNATLVCTIKSWIQCVGSGDVTVYVMRQV